MPKHGKLRAGKRIAPANEPACLAQPAATVFAALLSAVPLGLPRAGGVFGRLPCGVCLNILCHQAPDGHRPRAARAASQPRAPRAVLAVCGPGHRTLRTGRYDVVLLLQDALADARAHQGGGLCVRATPVERVLREHTVGEDRASGRDASGPGSGAVRHDGFRFHSGHVLLPVRRRLLLSRQPGVLCRSGGEHSDLLHGELLRRPGVHTACSADQRGPGSGYGARCRRDHQHSQRVLLRESSARRPRAGALHGRGTRASLGFVPGRSAAALLSVCDGHRHVDRICRRCPLRLGTWNDRRGRFCDDHRAHELAAADCLQPGSARPRVL